jgi:hypothetical protein
MIERKSMIDVKFEESILRNMKLKNSNTKNKQLKRVGVSYI